MEQTIIEIMVPLKYLSKFFRTFEAPLINCEANLILTSSAYYLKMANAIVGQVLNN